MVHARYTHGATPHTATAAQDTGGCEGVRTGCGVVMHLAQPQLLANEKRRGRSPLVAVVVVVLRRRSPPWLCTSLLAAAVAAVVLEHLGLVVLGQELLHARGYICMYARGWNEMEPYPRGCQGCKGTEGGEGMQGDGRRTEGGRKEDGRSTEGARKEDGRSTEGGRTSTETGAADCPAAP